MYKIDIYLLARKSLQYVPINTMIYLCFHLFMGL